MLSAKGEIGDKYSIFTLICSSSNPSWGDPICQAVAKNQKFKGNSLHSQCGGWHGASWVSFHDSALLAVIGTVLRSVKVQRKSIGEFTAIGLEELNPEEEFDGEGGGMSV